MAYRISLIAYRRKKVLLFVICYLLFVNLAGCASTANNDKELSNPALLEPQAVLRFSDIPVPVGFKLIAESSYSFESARVRVALLKYEGRVGADQTVNFYKEQMPMYNWNLLNAVEYGVRLLNFEREQESCIITLLPKGSSTIVTLSLSPKSSPQINKKSDKPIK